MHFLQSSKLVAFAASLKLPKVWNNHTTNEGTKKITIPAIARYINVLADFLISSSLLETTAFPKSNIPKPIINKGIAILKNVKIHPANARISLASVQIELSETILLSLLTSLLIIYYFIIIVN